MPVRPASSLNRAAGVEAPVDRSGKAGRLGGGDPADRHGYPNADLGGPHRRPDGPDRLVGQNVPYPGFSEPWGVWLSAGLIAASTVVLLFLFRRRGWL